MSAQELVPGDIIRLRSGDFIPADAKVADAQASVDQSSLTGESTAVAKKLTCILPLVRSGRTIYQRILIWIVNKISRTILKAGFVTLAFLITGKFVISAFGMMLLVFMTAFVKITLSTDHAEELRRPQTWKIAGWVKVAVVLGVLLVGEALGLLALAWQAFELAADLEALRTFSFLTLLDFALFSIVSIRERRAFWASMPSKILLLALVLDGLIGAVRIIDPEPAWALLRSRILVGYPLDFFQPD